MSIGPGRRGRFAVNLDAVAPTARRCPRAVHMFEADASQFLEYGSVHDQFASHDDRALAPMFGAALNRAAPERYDFRGASRCGRGLRWT